MSTTNKSHSNVHSFYLPGGCIRPSMARRNMGPSHSWYVWLTNGMGVRLSVFSPNMPCSNICGDNSFCASSKALVTFHRHTPSCMLHVTSASDGTRPKLHSSTASGPISFTIFPSGHRRTKSLLLKLFFLIASS